jgi:low affinity Fe/Cu permease
VRPEGRPRVLRIELFAWAVTTLGIERRPTGAWHGTRFHNLSTKIAYWTGTPASFVICIAIVAIWAATGPIFRFSDTWQLVINTGTTIVTFLMVFLIQNTQNRDGAALQTKLDELIRVSDAKNLFVGIERLTESEVEEIRR